MKISRYIQNITVTNPAENGPYSAVPAVTIAAPPAGGTQATAVAVLDDAGHVVRINMTEPGMGYAEINPEVTIAPPEPTLDENGEEVEGVAATATATTVGWNDDFTDVEWTHCYFLRMFWYAVKERYLPSGCTISSSASYSAEYPYFKDNSVPPDYAGQNLYAYPGSVPLGGGSNPTYLNTSNNLSVEWVYITNAITWFQYVLTGELVLNVLGSSGTQIQLIHNNFAVLNYYVNPTAVLTGSGTSLPWQNLLGYSADNYGNMRSISKVFKLPGLDPKGFTRKFPRLVTTNSYAGLKLTGDLEWTTFGNGAAPASFQLEIDNAGTVTSYTVYTNAQPVEGCIARAETISTLPVDGQLFKFTGGKFVAYVPAEGEQATADILTSWGRMRVGDYVGEWIFRELRDVLNYATKVFCEFGANTYINSTGSDGVNFFSSTSTGFQSPLSAAIASAAANYQVWPAGQTSSSNIQPSVLVRTQSDTYGTSFYATLMRNRLPLKASVYYGHRAAYIPAAEVDIYLRIDMVPTGDPGIPNVSVFDAMGETLSANTWYKAGETVQKAAGAIYANPMPLTFISGNTAVPVPDSGYPTPADMPTSWSYITKGWTSYPIAVFNHAVPGGFEYTAATA